MKRKVFAVIMAAAILMGVVASADTGTAEFLLIEIGNMKSKVSEYIRFFSDHSATLTYDEIKSWSGLIRLYFEMNNAYLVIASEYYSWDMTASEFDIGANIKRVLTQYENREITRDELIEYLLTVSSIAT